MEMQQLRHFIAASEHGNIGKAARALNITQPALSRSIRNLESYVGAVLLERTRRGVTPTVFGESLLTHARVIVGERHRAVEDVAALKGLHHGQVTLGITQNFSDVIVPCAVGDLLTRRPGLRISVIAAFYDEILARLRRGELDLAFSMFPLTHDEPDLAFEELYRYESRVYARADHPLAGKRSVTLRHLTEYGWIVVAQPGAMFRVFNEFFERNGLSPPPQVLKTDSIAFLRSAVVHTGLLSILPDHLLAAEVRSGLVACLAAECMSVPGAFGLIRRQRGTASPAAMAMMDALRREALRARGELIPSSRKGLRVQTPSGASRRKRSITRT
jgi:LysR family transcriptional regulator of gallate degradation